MIFDNEKFQMDILTKTRTGKPKKPLRDHAEEAGLSAATLSRLTFGSEPDITTFCKICAWLGTDVSVYFKPSA